MADNFLEYHREEYEKKKSKWCAKQKSAKNTEIAKRFAKKRLSED